MRKKRSGQRLIAVLAFGLLAAFLLFQSVALAQSSSAAVKLSEAVQTVRIIELRGEVNAAQRRYLQSELNTAAREGSALLLNVSLTAGRLEELSRMEQLLSKSEVPVSAYVSEESDAAGWIVALSCQTVLISPEAQLFSDETDAQSESAAFWRERLLDAAKRRGTKPLQTGALTAENALLTGLAEETAVSAQSAAEILWPTAAAEEIAPDFAVRLSRLLGSAAGSAVLLVLALLFLSMQLAAPQVFLFGLLSLGCFLLYFGGSFLAGYSQWWTLALLAVGAALLLVETCIPGFGVLGVSGVVCVAAALFLSARSTQQFLLSLAAALCAILLALPLLSRLAMRSKAFDRLILKEESASGGEGEAAQLSLVEKEGVALTPLRPAGKAKIGGERCDVQSADGYLPAGTVLRVLSHEGGRIVVSAAEPQHPAGRTNVNRKFNDG